MTVQAWHWPSVGLQLAGCEGLRAADAVALRRRLDARVPALRRWGRFERPIALRLAPSRAALVAAAPHPSALDLCGFAFADELWLLDPAAWPGGAEEDALAVVVLHELAHLLWFQRAAPAHSAPAHVPTWFREGFAVLASEGAPSPRERRVLAGKDLVALAAADDAQLAADPALGYRAAAHLFAAWHDRFGARGWTALCRTLRQGHGFSDAFARVCGQSEAAFVSAAVAVLRAEIAQR